MTVTFNLSMPSELLKLIDKQAKSELRTRSEFLRDVARNYILREKKWKSILRYGTARGRKMGIRTEEDVDRMIQEFRREQRMSKSKR